MCHCTCPQCRGVANQKTSTKSQMRSPGTPEVENYSPSPRQASRKHSIAVYSKNRDLPAQEESPRKRNPFVEASPFRAGVLEQHCDKCIQANRDRRDRLSIGKKKELTEKPKGNRGVSFGGRKENPMTFDEPEIAQKQQKPREAAEGDQGVVPSEMVGMPRGAAPSNYF
jgi:Zn-finger nucleic acid-binding protein